VSSSFFRSSLQYFFLLLLSSAVAFAGSDTAALSGTVIDSSGAAVADATVNLHQVAGSALLSAITGARGQFSFTEVAPGEYLLDAATRSLSVRQTQPVTLKPGEKKDVSLSLVVSAVRTQVSVTAAGTPQSVDQISKQLDIVSASEAEQRGIISVSDAIRFLPGLRVSTRGGPGTFTTIQARGLRVTDTAVLIDGLPFRDPTSIQDEASAYIGDLLLVDSSRLEVLQGSGSSLYGSNAMSGTVNIITDPGGGPTHGDIDLQGGGLGLFRGLARLSGGVLRNKLTYSAGLSRLNVTEGVDNAGAVRNWSGQGALNYALRANMRLGADLFANTGFLQENVSPMPTTTAPVTGIIPAVPLTTAQIHLADANQPYDPGNATFVPSLGDPDSGRYSHFINSLFRFEQQVNARLSYRLAYGIVDAARDNTDGPGGPGLFQPLFNTSDRYVGRIDTAQARVNYLLGSHQVLTAGYEFQREHYLDISTDENPDPSQRAFYRTDARQRTNAAFAQDELRLLDNRLAILLSGRFTQASLDQPGFIGGGLSPYAGSSLPSPPAAYTGDASISYFLRRSSTKLRAHGGNSFRLPSLYERFGGFLFQGFDFAYGDPRLSPERAVSVDFGIDQYAFHERLRLSATYFYSHLQQVISFLDFPPGYVDPYGRTAGYYNTPGGISRGVELSGEFRPNSRATVFASYTYTNAQDLVSQYFTGTNNAPLQSPRILPNEVSVVATQRFGNHVDLALDFEGGSAYLYPLYGYAYRFAGPRQLGLSAGYSLRLSERASARLYLRVSNALDQDYYEDGFRTPQRWAVGGIHFTF
jgi:iron complex outermembrane receptor protein